MVVLIVMNSTVPFLAAVWWGYRMGGVGGLLFGMLVGVGVGLTNFHSLKAVFSAISRWCTRCRNENISLRKPLMARGLLSTAAFLWVYVSALLAMGATHLAIRTFLQDH
jgi:hypothetical protein